MTLISKKSLTLLALLGLFTAFMAQGRSSAATGESYLVLEVHSGKVLLAANPDRKHPVASLTKMATAKVVLDWARVSRASLADVISVPQSALLFGGVNPLGLKPGDRISLRDALYSTLLGSDNIAAHTLADHVGRHLLIRRRRTGDPLKEFVSEMNQLAKALGMRKTRFATPHGLEVSNRSGYSTAADMARLGVHVMRDTGFSFFVKQKSRKITVIRADGAEQSYKAINTNKLLGQQGVNGIKTGLTTAAGQCMAVHAHRKPLVKKIDDTRSSIRKRDLVVVVLGSTNREARARQLIAQGWPRYDQWAAEGYPVSPKGRELIIVPRL